MKKSAQREKYRAGQCRCPDLAPLTCMSFAAHCSLALPPGDLARSWLTRGARLEYAAQAVPVWRDFKDSAAQDAYRFGTSVLYAW